MLEVSLAVGRTVDAFEVICYIIRTESIAIVCGREVIYTIFSNVLREVDSARNDGGICAVACFYVNIAGIGVNGSAVVASKGNDETDALCRCLWIDEREGKLRVSPVLNSRMNALS